FKLIPFRFFINSPVMGGRTTSGDSGSPQETGWARGVFTRRRSLLFFWGMLQAILGHNLWLIRLLQITLGAIACAWVFLVGRKLFSREAGIASGLILACYA